MTDSKPSTLQRWRVLKYGGSSVSEASHWTHIHNAVQAALDEGVAVVIVVSALKGITDLLAAQCHADSQQPIDALLTEIRTRHHTLLRDLKLELSLLDGIMAELEQALQADNLLNNPAAQATLMASGEWLSSHLAVALLRQRGVPAQWLDSREVLSTRSTHPDLTTRYLSAHCDPDPDPGLAQMLRERGHCFIMPGFSATGPGGATVLLGRGGSDVSATCLGTLLSADRVEIHSDVPGLFSADPRRIPSARLLRQVSYREAQELAAMGAKALSPKALNPVRRHQIPVWLCQTDRPDIQGTRIWSQARDYGAQVKAIVQRHHITLISMEGIGMWQQVGFLADVFAEFKALGFSVDQVSTSESNVTVTLDHTANLADDRQLKLLIERLEALCKVEVIRECACVSLVGLGIRTILHRLGPALEVFEQRRIFQVSQAANDLNLSFVVESRHAERLLQQLHQQLIPGGVGGDSVFGPSWEQLFRADRQAHAQPAWWRSQSEALMRTLGDHDSAYVYALAEVRQAAQALHTLSAVDRLLYSVKANPHPAILNTVVEAGLGLECVSLAEAQHARKHVADLSPQQMLLTANFAPREEYQQALAEGLTVTLDNLFILEQWGADFAGREVFLRLDPGSGLGHHKMVRTAGSHSKFGIPLEEIDRARRLTEAHDIRVIGLHAHTGSGILHPDNWHRTLSILGEAAATFSDVRIINLGGGLGVPDHDETLPLDLEALNAGLLRLRKSLMRPMQIWLEPGRYLVAQAGVLLSKVTQTKGKGDVRYMGVSTGMNSLIRPALYGAWHEIVNLTRLNEPGDQVYNVVGPICETGDVIGLDRLLPRAQTGDVILIANAGAYGAAMASRYNLREPAVELILEETA